MESEVSIQKGAAAEEQSSGSFHHQALAERIRQGDVADELVLDPDTGLESFLQATGCLGILLSFGFGFTAIADGNFNGMLAGLALLVGGCLLFILRFNLDDHYILNLKTKEVFFHRKFFGKTRKRLLYRFDDLAALLVDARRESTKSRSWWEYCLKLVPKKGRPVIVLCYKEMAQDPLITAGEVLAEELKVPLLFGPPEQRVKVKLVNGQPELQMVSALSASGCLVLGVALVILVGSIVGFVVSQ